MTPPISDLPHDKRATLIRGHKPRISLIDNFRPQSTPPQPVRCPRIASLLLLLTFPSSEMSNVNTGKKTRSAIADVVTREYTINLHKRVC